MLLMGSVTGCGDGASTKSRFQDADKLAIVTSIYPMYDFAHPIEDAIEGITHSICTLEFEDHRPLYDWVVRELEYPRPPKQIEFAKM